MFLGVRMKILLSAKETGGQFSLIEGVMPPGGDGGLHLHANEDKSMHLLEGEFEVTIGDKKFPLSSGESYFAPRNIPHRLRNLSQTPVRSLLLTTPGGFDAFISQAGVSADGRNHVAGRTSDARSNAETAEACGRVWHQDYRSAQAAASVKSGAMIGSDSGPRISGRRSCKYLIKKKT